jgi:hypothetical protein
VYVLYEQEVRLTVEPITAKATIFFCYLGHELKNSLPMKNGLELTMSSHLS